MSELYEVWALDGTLLMIDSAETLSRTFRMDINEVRKAPNMVQGSVAYSANRMKHEPLNEALWFSVKVHDR